MLLSALLWTGYKNVMQLLERDPVEGRLRLGLFVIVVVYNFTEAAFRSTDLVWIAFLLAIVALPVASPARGSAVSTRYAASPRPANAPVLEAEEVMVDQRLVDTDREQRPLWFSLRDGHVPKEQWR